MLLPPDLEAGTKAGSWSLGIQAGHLLFPSPALPGRGLGVYLRALLADGNPNPIRAGVMGGFRLTADLQVVNPASGASRTAVTGAVRANVAF